MKNGSDGSTSSGIFKIGDPVWSRENGRGVVCDVLDGWEYAVVANFESEGGDWFRSYRTDGTGQVNDSIVADVVAPLVDCAFSVGNRVLSRSNGTGTVTEASLREGVLVEFGENLARRYRVNGHSFASHDDDRIEIIPIPPISKKCAHATFDDLAKQCKCLTLEDLEEFKVWLQAKRAPAVDMQKVIADECESIKQILLEKNRKYGNAVIQPVRIFSKASPGEGIKVRLDDKLSRIISGQVDEDEDVDLDLIGYLIFKRIEKRLSGSGGSAAS